MWGIEARGAHLDVPLAALQQRYGLLDVLVGHGGELLEGQLLVLGQLADIDAGRSHGSGGCRPGPRGKRQRRRDGARRAELRARGDGQE